LNATPAPLCDQGKQDHALLEGGRARTMEGDLLLIPFPSRVFVL
jgi:hypothetical protein